MLISILFSCKAVLNSALNYPILKMVYLFYQLKNLYKPHKSP